MEVSGRVGYLAQDAHIFATSISENVRIGNRDATPEQVADALARAGLDLEPTRIVGEAGSTLSGGDPGDRLEDQTVAMPSVSVLLFRRVSGHG